MRAGEEQTNRHSQQELLRWCELVAVVHLLPHVEVIERSRVEFEGYTPDPVEHQVRTEHVGEICESPGGVPFDAGDNAEENLEGNNEDYVNGPRTCESRNC